MFAHQADSHGIPLADRFVSSNEWVFTGPTGGVVPKAAASLFIAILAVVFSIGIPDLHLWDTSEVNS